MSGGLDAVPRGFLFSAVSCGIKRQAGELDLALVFSEVPASVAGVFTTNRVAAAPVLLDKERLSRGTCRGILANAGCANACTGPEGYRDALQSTQWMAQALGIVPEEVLVASTGVIGTRLPMDRLREGIPHLARGLDASRLEEVARAIMTTDTRPKWTSRKATLEGAEVRMAAVVKGAGMIHPRMATMLCFVVTDAHVGSSTLQRFLVESLDSSFHSITVDGDTSTNDTLLVLANGACGGEPILEGSESAREFQQMLREVLEEMAMEVVRDAEGATKLVHVLVEGATSDSWADKVARSIAHSPLVKTAFYGQEVNWGRIVAAAGYSGAPLEPDRIDLWYGDVQVLRGGRPLGEHSEKRAVEVAKLGEFTIRIGLGLGQGRALIHTCDLSHGYVTINGSYRS
ncbi:MAG: bifunctional glutamate N-acetyltransferase/amino-acid acetyltransferase ArgJ [Thermodesulfobacteriota bacterium]